MHRTNMLGRVNPKWSHVIQQFFNAGVIIEKGNGLEELTGFQLNVFRSQDMSRVILVATETGRGEGQNHMESSGCSAFCKAKGSGYFMEPPYPTHRVQVPPYFGWS